MGSSGVGKSTVCVLLRENGQRALDADWDGFNHWVHRSTGQVMVDPPYPVPPGWLDDYAWRIDAERVRTLAKEARADVVFLAGSVENEVDVWDQFDVVVCLVADDATLEHRLAARTTNHFGKHPDELSAILAWNRTAEATYRSFGATIVDATQPPDIVVQQVIEATDLSSRVVTVPLQALALRLERLQKAQYSLAEPVGANKNGRVTLVVEHDDFAGWVKLLGHPVRAKRAYWHLVLSGSHALPAIRNGLKAPDAEIRMYCAKALDHLVDEESFPELIAMLDDPDPRVRWDTLHALACDRCKETACRPDKDQVLPRAITLLHHDPSEHVRAIACEVVARWVHTDEVATSALLTARNDDPSPSVRKKASWHAPDGTIYRKTQPR